LLGLSGQVHQERGERRMGGGGHPRSLPHPTPHRVP
jgi:hypothetical protein